MADDELLAHRDAALIARTLPVGEWLCRHYLRLDVAGQENIAPAPTLYVANHSGGITGPDVACTLATLWRTLGAEAPLYALAHDFAMKHVPPFGRLIRRFGALPANRKNALRVLEHGGSVLVYPGGDLDAYRSWKRRDEVVILPRTGFVATARTAGVRIVPVVAQGAHRSGIIFHEGQGIARALGLGGRFRLDRFPLALALPWGFAPGPLLPWLPLPFRVRLRFLPAVEPRSDESDLECATRVQTVMQAVMTELAAR